MANDFYTHGSYPITNASGASASMRAELDLITAGFDKFPTLSTGAARALVVNGAGTAVTLTTGTLALAGNFATSGAYALTCTLTAATSVTFPTTGTLATLAGSETLTTKTINLTSNTLTGTTAQFNAALSDNDFATLAGTETLINKTLTSPIIGTISNTGTLTLPTSTDTLVGKATTDTLTNKTLTSPVLNGTITGSAVLSVANGGTGAGTLTSGSLIQGNGTGAVTALAAGTAGQVVHVNAGAGAAAFHTVMPTQTFRGLSVRSHYDSDSVTTKIVMIHADEIVVSDGTRVAPADLLVLDKAVTGSAGGMQAAAVASTWNKLYYIRKSSDGTEGLWGLRAKNYSPDQSQTTDNAVAGGLNFDATVARLAQGIQVTTTGRLEFVDIKLNKAGSPTGNYWLEVQSDTAGSPSVSVLATSDKYDVSRLTTTATFVRIPFRTPATLTATTQYHLVLRADTSVSSANYFQWFAANTSVYANGVAKRWDGSAWQTSTNVPFTAVDFCFKLYVTANDTTISLPSGYDQYAQIGWFYLDSGGLVKRFSQQDRRISTGRGAAWKFGTLTSTTAVLSDLSAFIPPIPTMAIFVGQDSVGTYHSSLGHIRATDTATAVDLSDTVCGSHQFIGATVVPSLQWPAILLEYQAMMQVSGSATTHAWLGEFTW